MATLTIPDEEISDLECALFEAAYRFFKNGECFAAFVVQNHADRLREFVKETV